MIVTASPVGVPDAPTGPTETPPADGAFALLLAAAGGTAETVVPVCALGTTGAETTAVPIDTATETDAEATICPDEVATALATHSILPRMTAPFAVPLDSVTPPPAGDRARGGGPPAAPALDDLVLTTEVTGPRVATAVPTAVDADLAGRVAPTRGGQAHAPTLEDIALEDIVVDGGDPTAGFAIDADIALDPTPVAPTGTSAVPLPAPSAGGSASDGTPTDRAPAPIDTALPPPDPARPTGAVAPASIGRLVAATVPELRSSNNDMRLSVRLDPPSLGQVTVDISTRDGAVHVVIRPTEASATGVLDAQRAAISAALSDAGFELGGFDVRAGDQRDAPKPSAPRRVDAGIEIDAIDGPSTDDGALRL
jgi:flagellar hook-length control protein FliK